MNNMELVLNMLVEASSIEIYKSKNTIEFNAKQSVLKGGNIAKIAREQLEKETGKKRVISNKNDKELRNEKSQRFLN